MSKLRTQESHQTPDVTKVFAAVETVVTDTQDKITSSIQPIRETVLKRYPTLFALLVTAGVSATFLGIEQLFLSVNFFNRHPEAILLIGVAILFLTGRLYKKLS